MTNVSRKKTASEDYNFAYERFIEVIANLKNSNALSFFEEFFTDVEKIMFVKRFAAIFLFHQGHPPYRVSLALGLSLSTVQRLHEQYTSGHFDKLIQCIPKKQKRELTSMFEDFILSKVSFKARTRLLKRLAKK
jgi:uncharacterized protein YerC